MVERLVAVWCPSLVVEGERGEEARDFVRVLRAAETICPWVEPVRLGELVLPARGPSRFFGGEAAVVERLRAVVVEVLEPAGNRKGTGDGEAEEDEWAPGIGVADGLFAATLASRSQTIADAGRTAEFLAPWSVAVLRRPELAVTLQRLGVHTLGQFAELPATHVSARFGGDAAACHRVARGEDGELLGLRDPAIFRRLRVVRGEIDEASGEGPGGVLGDALPAVAVGVGVGAGTPRQPGFFGGTSAADARAARCIVKVQQRLGVEAVVVGRLRGGRDPAGRAQLLPWGSRDAAAPDEGRDARSTTNARSATAKTAATTNRVSRASRATPPTAPWPGCLPTPSPVAVLAVPAPVELGDTSGSPVQVSGRGLLSAEPDRLSIEGGPWQRIGAWAGPWPSTERWWSGSRRRARLQVVTVGGVAVLLAAEGERWWLEALYD